MGFACPIGKVAVLVGVLLAPGMRAVGGLGVDYVRIRG